MILNRVEVIYIVIKWLKPPILLLSASFLLSVGWLSFTRLPDSIFAGTISLRFVHDVSKQVLHGHLNGQFHGHVNGLNTSQLEPGDIVLCHNRGGGYGYWTHAVLYIGRGYMLDSNDFADGTRLFPASRYLQYDSIAILRAKVPYGVRHDIAAAALNQVGKTYNPFSGVTDERSEYCSKLIWQVYMSKGILLCRPSEWILPDDIYKSPKLEQQGRWDDPTPTESRDT